MTLYLFNCNRTNLFGDQARQPLIHRHSQFPNTLMAQAKGRGQHQIRAVGLQQVGGANLGTKTPRNQRDHIHQGLGWFTGLCR